MVASTLPTYLLQLKDEEEEAAAGVDEEEDEEEEEEEEAAGTGADTTQASRCRIQTLSSSSRVSGGIAKKAFVRVTTGGS